ncbi:MAG: DNA gyrase inhibitor YacG [Pseudomonadota bacterium]
MADKPACTRVVRCPGCGGESLYAPSNPARPFCSERCKNMDFGAWASESFRVPAPIEPDDLDIGNTTLQ